jgi:hypothetical protein
MSDNVLKSYSSIDMSNSIGIKEINANKKKTSKQIKRSILI